MPRIPHCRLSTRATFALALSFLSLAIGLVLPTRFGELLWPSAQAANTFTVTNTNDSGPGSLRQAIIDANANSGLDTINFSIGSGVQTITILSALPIITDPVIIDGTTQPSFAGTPIIELNGNRNSDHAGLLISAVNSTVRGLVINRFNSFAIVLDGGGNRVEGNYIGTDVTGTVRMDNVGGVGIDSSNNIIGGTVSGTGNLISGNIGEGIIIESYEEVFSGNLIQGNLIGTNATGTAALGNNRNGVLVAGVCPNNTIGGTTPGAGNVISGNGVTPGNSYSGVRIEGTTSTGNVVQGNLIGTNAAGTAPLQNAYHGIEIIDAPGTIIGGTTPAARNIISGNKGSGINLGSYSDGSSSGNTVQGNFIGTGADGRTPIPNGLLIFTTGGIYIYGSNNIIGGSATGAGNLIAFNGQPLFDDQAGVQVVSGTGNTIRGNSIFSNNGPGIELVPYGITANDANDTDAGVNNLQNFPVITSVTPDSSTTTIQGTLNSTPNTSFAIDFYASSACDPSGNGEGTSYLGSSNVMTAGNGNASFNVTLPTVVSAGRIVTATATNPAGNTSEFSPCSAGSTTGYVKFSALNLSASEGIGTATVSVTRTGGSTGTIVVNYATSDGTATAGQDYTATSGTLTFADGETSKSFGIPFINDSLDENNETINLTLKAAGDADTVGNPGAATLSITDNDPSPSLSINDVSVVEGNTGTTNAVFTVTLSVVSGRRVTTSYSTYNQTATVNSDYQGTSGTLIFNPGVTTQTITVPVIGDTVAEPDETFIVSLESASAAFISDNQGIGTILNDDFTPTLQFSAASYSAGEGDGNVTVTVTRTGSTSGAVSVQYDASDGTATAGSDYTATSGTLTFADGQTSNSFNVPILEDAFDELNETLTLTLSNPTGGATLGPPSNVTLTINDNDPRPTLSINDVSVTEGDSGTTSAVFTVTLSAASGLTVSVQYVISDDTATTPDDYTSEDGGLIFNPGETSKQITVTINGDTSIEPDEQFIVGIGTSNNATVSDPEATGTILNDDNFGQLQLSTNAYSVSEGGSSASVTVTRTGGTSGEVSVSFATTDGTATSGADYTAVSQTVTFAAGDAADKTINIPINNDSEYEGPETVNLALTNATGGAGLGNPHTATLTIDDNDSVPSTLVVNSTNDIDDGLCNSLHCSLREALNAANSSAGANTISFNIAGSGVKTIAPAMNLPPITEQLTIDGYTQTGAHPNTLANGDDAVLLIELDGSNITANASGVGLDLATGNSTIRGLAINRFNLCGIRSQANAGGNIIEGNFIGTDAPGTAALANLMGILIQDSSNNTVGGTLPENRNLLSGNLFAGLFLGGASSGNKAQGNFIGTSANGTGALGNGDPNAVNVVGGVHLVGGAATANNTIGGTESGAGNRIAFNLRNGVFISGGADSPTGNAILSNSIFANNSMGIDLSSTPFGVTENDPGDVDSGPNGLQNFPVLTSAVIDGGSTMVQGTLNSSPNTEFRLEFFSNPACDDSGHGEGQTFIGSKMLTTGSDGNASFTFTPSSAVAGGQFITATATDPTNNTSEFSACVAVSAPQGTLQFNAAAFTVDESGLTATIEVSRTGGSNGAVSVQYATANGTAVAGSDYETTSGTLQFADGQTSNTFTIPVLEDTLDEQNETVTLTLTNATGGASTGSPNTATLTITDNDQQPGLSINDVTFTGANSLIAVTPEFVVTLSAASGQTVTVQYATANGTATSGSDYNATNGTLTFQPGQTTRTIPITIIGDKVVEPTETFFVNLTNASNASITDAQGTGTIPNDDHTYTISGRALVGTTPLSGVTIKLSGAQTAQTTTNAQGSYTFAGLMAGGNYTVTPTKTNYTFTPASTAFSNLSADKPNQNFTARLLTFTISGTVKLGTAGLGGVAIKLTSPTPAGFPARTVTTQSNGQFTIPNLPAGRTYTLTPTKAQHTFTPASRTYTNLSRNEPGANFTARLLTYTISGRVTKVGTTTGVSAVTMTLTSPTPAGFASRTVQTGSTGNYTFTNLPGGRNYTIKPTKTGYTFTPATRSFTNLSTNLPAGSTTSFTGKPTTSLSGGQ